MAPVPLKGPFPSGSLIGDRPLPVLDEGATPPDSADNEVPDLLERAKKRRSAIESIVSPNGLPVAKAKWTPLHLRTYFLVFNIILLVILAVVLEVLLYINGRDYGWGQVALYQKYPHLHVFWTCIPAFIAWLLVQQWIEVDRCIKLLQPYVDMSSGGVSAEKSVMLNYSGRSNIFVQFDLVRNRHLTAFISNSLCLLAICIAPLAGGLFYLQTPPNQFTKPLSDITVVERLGFQDPFPYQNLEAASGFIQASSVYSVAPPPFIRFMNASSWTSSRAIFTGIKDDGTVKARTVCIKSIATCVAPASLSFNAATGDISGSSTSGNCTFNAKASDSPGYIDGLPSGISLATCSSSPSQTTAPNLSSVAFWALPFGNNIVATICTPSIQIQEADSTFNATSSSLLDITGQVPLSQQDIQSDGPSVDTSQAPFNGSAFNGLLFSNVSTPEAAARLRATQYNVGAGIAASFKARDPSAADASIFKTVAADMYGHYLGMVTQNMYFLKSPATYTNGTLHLATERFFVSSLVTHLLAAVLLLIASGGALILFLYTRSAHRSLHLTSEPGTLATAVAMAGSSDLAALLNGKDSMEEMKAVLSDLQFRIDKETGTLVVEEADHGYAEVPYDYDLEYRSPRLRESFSSKMSPITPMTSGSTLTSATYKSVPVLDRRSEGYLYQWSEDSSPTAPPTEKKKSASTSMFQKFKFHRRWQH